MAITCLLLAKRKVQSKREITKRSLTAILLTEVNYLH